MSNEARLTRIEEKLDKVGERLGSIDTTLAGQHVSLKHHIHRTDLLESKIAPIERHVAMVHGALKLLGAGAALFGVIEGLIALLTFLK